MNADCQWVEENLEALFCDRLGEAENRLARTHIQNCASCANEVQALNAIEPLVKTYFHRQLEIARRPPVLHRGKLLGIGGAAAAVVALMVVLVVGLPQPDPVSTPAPAAQTATPVAEVERPGPIKADEPGEILRAKPSPALEAPPDQGPYSPPAVSANAPDFLVIDPAGYSHTLDEYRGRAVIVGVWNSNHDESIAAIERLYRTYSANTKLRFLGVSNEHQAKPANTTFPVLYNQGSKLLGARPGDFVLLDENGAVELRGSLVKDADSLRKALQGK